jgi:hypothetical protein
VSADVPDPAARAVQIVREQWLDMREATYRAIVQLDSIRNDLKRLKDIRDAR